ncbi:hypothetical protein Tco_1414078 [Tanacetum coccineum]
MSPSPPREQRNPFLRYQGLEYTDADIADFEEWLEMIYIREIHRVHVVDFQGMPELMRDSLFARMVMKHRNDVGVVVFTSRAWERLFDTRGPLVRELILKFLSTLRFREVLLDLDAPSTIQFQLEILRGLTVITPELLIIDMGELVRLQISLELDDTCTWVAMGPERQPDAAASTLAVAEDAPAVDEGGQAVPAPVQAPQQPPPPPHVDARTMPQRLGRLEEEVQGLHRDVGTLRGLVDKSMIDQGIFSTWMISCMEQLMDDSGLTYQAFDGTFRGSSPAAFQRRTRQRTSEASTSIAQQDPQQPDP